MRTRSHLQTWLKHKQNKHKQKNYLLSHSLKSWKTYQQIYIWQEVEDVLQLVNDLVVDWKFPCCYSFEVRANIQQLWVESFKAVNLVCDALRQRTNCCIFDIPGKSAAQVKLIIMFKNPLKLERTFLLKIIIIIIMLS